MNQRKRNTFQKAYNDYADLYSKKKYQQCLDSFIQIEFNSNYKTNQGPIDFLLRSACHAITTLQNPNTKYIVTLANAYETVFSEIAQSDAFDKYLAILNNPFFDKCVKFVSKLPPSAFDLRDWLHAINTHLYHVLIMADIVDDIHQTERKKIYLQMTHVLLTFVNAEEQRAITSGGRRVFSESQRFIANCKEFLLFREGKCIAQYNMCFDLLNKLLDVLSLEADKGKQANGIQQFLEEFNLVRKSKDLRGTLVQDNYITVAKMIKACESQFIKAIQLDPKYVLSYFDLIGSVAHGATQVTSEKPFCMDCKAIGIHCCHEITMITVEMYLALLQKQVNDAIVEKFSYIMRTNFEAISKLTCARALNTQTEAIRKFQILNQECKTKEKTAFLIPILRGILKYNQRIKMMKETAKWFDQVHLLNYLFIAYDKAEQMNDMLNVGYLLLATRLAIPNHTITVDQIAWPMIKKQKEKNSQYTPFDHFDNLKKSQMYGAQLPEQFDLEQVTLKYLCVGMKYNIMAPELTNKIIHQLIASATELNAMRFAFFVQSVKFDKLTNERVDKIIKKLHAKSKNDLSLTLQAAALKYLRFNSETMEFTEKHNGLSISGALTEEQLALDTNIFRTVTLDFEKNHIDTLRYVKERFIKFTYFYLGQINAEERNNFEDEKDFLLRELKVVANQFIVRDYLDDGMDLYMALYKLAKQVNDEFGLLDACSFFAEYRSNCKQRFPKENLNVIVKNCYSVAVTKLKELQKLPMRKQNQVCFCILNLVLFYYEEDAEYHSTDINVILAFIFKTIGGIGDKEMEASMDAVIGARPTVDDGTLPKIQNQVVRIKFYSILFTIITKYGAPSDFHPSKFVEFVLVHLKKHLGIFYDSTATVPILMFNMVPEMLLWLAGRYDFCVEDASLLLTLIKLSLRSGYALRAVNIMNAYMQIELLTEKLSQCKVKFSALEHIMLSEVPTTEEPKKLEDNVNLAVNLNDRLCEPIRKHKSKTSPIKCLSPRHVNQRDRVTFVNKFLLKHQDDCPCGVCANLHNKFQMFCTAVAYARYVYINDKEFDVTAKRVVFNELFEYWENSRKEENKAKQFPRTELYYVVSARMLSYCAHFEWKYEKNYALAKELFARGLKGLDRLKHDAKTMKNDFKHQIDKMTSMIEAPTIEAAREALYGGCSVYISRRKKFDFDDDELSAEMAPAKKPQKQTKTINEALIKPMSLLDLIDDKPPKSTTFQIHDDGAYSGVLSTPNIKKTTRGRGKKIEKSKPKEVGCLITVKSPEAAQRRQRLPKVGMPNPSIQNDLMSPPETANEQNS